MELSLLPKIAMKGQLITIDGRRVRFRVDRFVLMRQSDNPKKVFVVQELIFENGKKELRFGYYIVGKRPAVRGKWVWGQFAPLISRRDFKKLIKLVREKGLI